MGLFEAYARSEVLAGSPDASRDRVVIGQSDGQRRRYGLGAKPMMSLHISSTSGYWHTKVLRLAARVRLSGPILELDFESRRACQPTMRCYATIWLRILAAYRRPERLCPSRWLYTFESRRGSVGRGIMPLGKPQRVSLAMYSYAIRRLNSKLRDDRCPARAFIIRKPSTSCLIADCNQSKLLGRTP